VDDRLALCIQHGHRNLSPVEDFNRADDVDNSYDDYNKYTLETLVEAGGDCEDTCIPTRFRFAV
jgi:hypothetical protein